MDKALDQSLSKKNIKIELEGIKIWPLNAKAMDDKIKPSEMYAPTIINILDEDNESFDGKVNDIQWGENGATMKLLNIIVPTKDVGLEDEVNV